MNFVRRNSLACVSIATVSMMLAACGGGGSGVASTPPPAPAPTPPAPPPPPTGANANLLGPLVSESFRSIAALGSLSVPTSGANVTASAKAGSIDFVYDAATSSYKITEGSTTSSFAVSSLDATQSTPTLNSYKNVSGQTTEFLSLVKAGTGTGQTRYVGSGYWQRQTNGATTVEGRYTAFTYGAQTPDAPLPRTGSASFNVNLLGVRTFSSTVYALSGDGTINVDFLSGALAGSGRFGDRNVETGIGSSGFGWRSYALLSSTANSFAGRIELDNFGSGPLNGAFYGPVAEEIGGAFSTNTSSENAVVGAIAGARGTTPVNTGTSLGGPSAPMFYKAVGSSFSANGAAALSSLATSSAVTAVHQGVSGVPFYLYNAGGRITQPFPANGPPNNYKLLGTSFQYLRGVLQIDTSDGKTLFDSAVFGFDTAATAVPRTGSASFNVALNGAVATPGAVLQGLTGNGSLSVNFAQGTLATLGNFGNTNASPMISGIAPNVSTGSWSGNGTLSSNANSYSSSITLAGAKTYTGTLNGKFFGPAADQTGATFNATAGDGSIANGALTGARGDDTTASQMGLAALTSTTVLPGTAKYHTYTAAISPPNSSNDDRTIEVTYDPIAKSYQFTSKTTGANVSVPLVQALTQAEVVGAQSDATFTVYRAGTTDARIFNWGAANPRVQLTYTSFAEITKPVNNRGNPATATYYVPFGGLTPNFQVPTSGTATYNGVVYGRGGGGSFSGTTQLSGTSLFSVNFGAGTGELAMTLTATDTSAIARSLGTFNFRGTAGVCQGCFSGSNSFSLSADPTQSINGIAIGNFFGPNAAEFGTAFNLNLQSGVYSGATFTGVSVGKKN